MQRPFTFAESHRPFHRRPAGWLACLLLLFLLAPAHGAAQHVAIGGRVCEAGGRPLPAALVQLFADSARVAAGRADSAGCFVFDGLAAGDYRLHIAAVGYEGREVLLRGGKGNERLGDIVLAPLGDRRLGEAVVEGKRAAYADGYLLVYPSAEDKRHADDGFMLAQRLNLPNVAVDVFSGRTTRFDQAVTYCINNRPASDAEIRMLNPRDVVRVEFHEEPHGEFEGRTTVINYILREHRHGGRAGLRATQTAGRHGSGSYMAYAQLAAGRSEWTLTADPGSYQNYNRKTDRTDWFDDGGGWFARRREGAMAPVRRLSPAAQLSYGYRAERHNVFATAGFAFNRSRSASRYAETDGRSGRTATVESASTGRTAAPSARLYYRFADGGRNVFTLDANYGHSHNNAAGTNRTTYGDGSLFALDSRARENYHNASLLMTYTRKLRNKWTLSLISINGTDHTAIGYAGAYSANASESSQTYTQEMATLDIPAGAWHVYLQYGLMFMHETQTGMGRRRTWHHRPRVQLRYNLGKRGQNVLQVSKVSGGLPLSRLADVEQQLNELEWQRGNPGLRFSESVEVWDRFTHELWGGHVSARAYYIYTQHNPTAATLREGTGAAPRFVHTWADHTTAHTLTFSLGYNRRFLQRLNVGVYGEWNRCAVRGTGGGAHSWWYGYANLSYAHKGFMAGLHVASARTRTGGSLVYTHTPATWQLYGGYRWRRLALMAAWQNPWRQASRSFSTQAPAYRTQQLTADDASRNAVLVQLSWNVSFGRKHKFDDVELRRGGRSGIVGAP